MPRNGLGINLPLLLLHAVNTEHIKIVRIKKSSLFMDR